MDKFKNHILFLFWAKFSRGWRFFCHTRGLVLELARGEHYTVVLSWSFWLHYSASHTTVLRNNLFLSKGRGVIHHRHDDPVWGAVCLLARFDSIGFGSVRLGPVGSGSVWFCLVRIEFFPTSLHIIFFSLHITVLYIVVFHFVSVHLVFVDFHYFVFSFLHRSCLLSIRSISFVSLPFHFVLCWFSAHLVMLLSTPHFISFLFISCHVFVSPLHSLS